MVLDAQERISFQLPEYTDAEKSQMIQHEPTVLYKKSLSDRTAENEAAVAKVAHIPKRNPGATFSRLLSEPTERKEKRIAAELEYQRNLQSRLSLSKPTKSKTPCIVSHQKNP